MFRSLLLICLGCIAYVTASENFYLPVQDQNPLASEILLQQPDVILFCTEAKVYLRPEKIHTTEHGILLGDQYSKVYLPFLFADESGCYIPMASRPNSDYTGYWICWTSDCENYGNIWRSKSNKCPKCGKPGFAA